MAVYSSAGIYTGLKSILYDGKKAIGKEAILNACLLDVDFAKKVINIADWKGLLAKIYFNDNQTALVKKFPKSAYYRFHFKVINVMREPSEPSRVTGITEGNLIGITKN